ncbi:uncharacterized protein LOC136040841 [Artemia franciscana]|uniref:SHSP domain-containing protein n=2 Tax=Artemia franciscana TaxID=6661 RepID=A0AA88KZN1_ARTSF|nr:hypothetical protein QYM36_009348 [Artemia franciscana]KAK2713444.1 hypothetical protein QYM36_009348 [Artemia franciscana]
MALIEQSRFPTHSRWFEDIEKHMQNIQQSFFKRSYSDCGLEMPLQLATGETNTTWKLLDDISPFKPEDVQVKIDGDGKSISLDAKTEQTTKDGGKISRAISKRWAWSGGVDANDLNCFIKDGALMIKAKENVALNSSPSSQVIHIKVDNLNRDARNGSTAIPNINKEETMIKTNVEANSRKEVKEESKTEANFSKVHTGSVANARRLFENVSEKEKSVNINKIDANISEHKLRASRENNFQPVEKKQSLQSDGSQEIKVERAHDGGVVVKGQPSTETVIPTKVYKNTSSVSADQFNSLSLFDDSLLSFERKFWEQRMNAMKMFHEVSKNLQNELAQNFHWPNIFEDSRILRSNFNEINKTMTVKENNITAKEFQVALDVAGCPVENLSVRVSDDKKLVVEAQWRDGFTDRLARREWILPSTVHDDDVKCTMSTDGILVIKVNLQQPAVNNDRKIPIMQQ